MGKTTPVDKPFLITTGILVVLGFFIFASASLGFLVRGEGVFMSVAVSQAIGLVLGLAAMYLTSRISYKVWGKYAFYFFLFSLGLVLLVFVPGIGFEHGGAKRWLDLGVFSLQPAEILKLAFVVYWATWIAGARQQIRTVRYGMVPLLVILSIVGTLLALQPDMDTLMMIVLVGVSMFLVGGGRWSHVSIVGLLGVSGLALAALVKPYIRARIMTFLDPSLDPLGASYQLQQSLIAIGSGEWFGRGLGQSVQKFNFLPEPIGDSIFAVFAEEWGFIGAIFLITLFLVFFLRGMRIASHAPTVFSRLVVFGIVLMIVLQSFINIAAMLGIVPLSGMPLLFVSQGGSALLVTLAAVGIVLNISRYQRQ